MLIQLRKFSLNDEIIEMVSLLVLNCVQTHVSNSSKKVNTPNKVIALGVELLQTYLGGLNQD